MGGHFLLQGIFLTQGSNPGFLHCRQIRYLLSCQKSPVYILLFSSSAHKASLSFIISQSLLKLMSIESVMPSNHLILCPPLLLLPSIFPIIRVFSNESVFCIRWPKYWSFSFNISIDFFQDGLVGSPCSPRDSQESSSTPQFKRINSLALSLLYGSSLTSVHDY